MILSPAIAPSRGNRPTNPSHRICGQEVPRRGPSADGRVRVLFLSMYHLGWKTWCRYIENYTPACAEMQAVHFHVQQPFWMRLANTPLPRPINRAWTTPAKAWSWHLRRHLGPSILAGEYDVVFANSQILLPGLIDFCRRSGTQLMVCTDVTGPAYTRDLLGQDATARSWSEEQSIYDACSLCVPMSEWIADSLEADFGVPRENILVVPPMIAAAAPAAAATVAPRRSGLLRLLFCGNDWRRKGGPRLVEWHQRYWTGLAELHIVSQDADVRPGLTNVINHGSVPNERVLRHILPNADVFCLPTLQDMSPFAVSEAQAFGIPTVASRIGGMADLVLAGKTGFLIPANDDAGFIEAVTLLLTDATLRTSMRQAALEHARAELDAAVVIPRLLTRIVATAKTRGVEAAAPALLSR